MSLETANFRETVMKQYFYKLKANIDSFSSLIGIQLIAILFSLGGSTSLGTLSGSLHFRLSYYSADIVIVFTMIWAFVTGITITTKPFRYQDFTFVTNRISSSLSNMLFLFTSCLIGAMLAVLSRNLILVISHFFLGNNLYAAPTPVGDMLLSFIISLLYIFGISSIGYFIGALAQFNKLFTVLVPVLIIGSLFLEGAMMGAEPFLIKVVQFYIFESSVILFIIKILLSTALFFGLSITIFNRMEVRR